MMGKLDFSICKNYNSPSKWQLNGFPRVVNVFVRGPLSFPPIASKFLFQPKGFQDELSKMWNIFKATISLFSLDSFYIACKFMKLVPVRVCVRGACAGMSMCSNQ